MNTDDQKSFEKLGKESDEIVAEMSKSNSSSDREQLYARWAEKKELMDALLRKDEWQI